MNNKEFFDNYFSYRNLDTVDLRLNKDIVSYVSSATYKAKKTQTESQVIVRQISTHGIIKKFSDPGISYSGARLNPSGTRMAIVQKKGKSDYLLIYNLENHREEKLAVETNIHSIEWKDDESLVLLMTDPVAKDKLERKALGDDPIFFEKEDPFWSLYSYRPSDGIGKITSGLQVWEFDVLKNTIVVVGSDSPTESSWYEAKLYTINISDGERTLIYDPWRRQIARPRISPDGKNVAFLESLLSDRGVDSGDIIVTNLPSKNSSNATEGMERSYSDISWGKDGRMYALWTMELNFGVSVFDGKWTDIWKSLGTVYPLGSPEFSLSEDHLAFVFSDDALPQEVMLLSPNGSLDTISSDNMSLKENLKKYPYELLKWKADDGLEIYGLLRSLGPDKPLIVDVHGGPTSFSGLVFLNRNNLYLDNGFSVFSPNYRGSIGKGRKYAESNIGDLGGKDFQDIRSGIQFLRTTGRLRSDNIFITGGSYGGFMSAWAITQTDIFKASVSLFGISDWLSFHGTSNLSTWDRLHMDDDPYAHKLYEKFSPINYVDKVKAPILLMHGEMDKYVPVGQYMQLYRALKDHGKEAELIIFPREGHGFKEKLHQETYLKKAVEWFVKHSS